MPKTPPTIVAPLPDDPRVMSLAKTVSLTRREAFAAAAEAWAWMARQAVDGIVPQTAPDSLDSVVDIAAFGQAMLQAGLVGVVNDGLVLPAELRRREQHDERGGGAAAAAEGGDEDGRERRRKEQNAAAARRYRKRHPKPLGSKPKSSGNAWRSLGRVAGHEVRVFDGPHGIYALLLGATVGGETSKLTAGNKSWSLDTVTLADVVPGLVEKWKVKHQREAGRFVPQPLSPTYEALRDDADKIMALAKVERAAAAHEAPGVARHADDDDASSRHADASSSVIIPSSSPEANGERKSCDGMGLDAPAASSSRHADALSSISVSLTSSSYKEEDMGREGREAGASRERYNLLVRRFAHALGQDEDTIRSWWRHNRDFLRMKLGAAGIDPKTGLPVNAEGAHEPAAARDDIGVTTEPIDQDRPVAGNVVARGDDEFACSHLDIHDALRGLGIPSPASQALPAEDNAFEDERRRTMDQLLKQGA
jgi:hypothetical protein